MILIRHIVLLATVFISSMGVAQETFEANVDETSVGFEMNQDETHRYVLLSKAKLTSKDKGEFQLAPVELNVTVEMPSGKRDGFGRAIIETINKNIETEHFTISVK